MESIKVALFGADGYTCQIPRIKEGMKFLGHVLSEESPDLIYANDPSGYQKAMELKKKFSNAHLMFNFLDIPWHMPNIEKQTKLLVDHFLNKANSVTAISFKVKNDLSKFLNKKIDVIYNPSKDVFYDKSIKKNNNFLYVGRANDPIKRINLVRESLSKINNSINEIKICGSENPGFGNYLGVISDIELNKIYNSSKFVLLPSKAEGIGLSMIEAMICGTIPITCSDNLTAKEFSPEGFICEPTANSIIKKIQELDKNYENKRIETLKLGEKYKIQFDKKSIASNIIKIFFSN
jgi:glycosyltransferase involved in cell wall biosynthesis